MSIRDRTAGWYFLTH
ncbi:hypothetical protein E2G97_07505 [Salmonella enterica subsp. enterica serovar Augustenborg]|nr:hypothetical protein [Salmonella enterica subsp. enterica serovar Augustenborg]